MGKVYIVAPKKSVLTKMGMAHSGAEIKPDMLKGEDKKKTFEDLKEKKVIIPDEKMAEEKAESKPEKAAPKKGAPKKTAEKPEDK